MALVLWRLVFKHRLTDYDIWKTCFMQLKHNEKGGIIPSSGLRNMSGEFGLLNYFESYCQINPLAPELFLTFFKI
jgi:hypothetical protein